jgi:hypothetical protein
MNKLISYYHRFSDSLSAIVIRVLSTKLSRQILTFMLTQFFVVMFFSNYLYFLYFIFFIHLILSIVTMLHTTDLKKYLKMILYRSTLQNFYIITYAIFYIIFTAGAWLLLLFTTQGWSGLLYFYVAPVLIIQIIYTIIVSIVMHKNGYRFIKLNNWYLIWLFVLQTVLMVFNFRDSYGNGNTDFQNLSSSLAVIISPIYFLSFLYFTVFTPFKTVKDKS